MFAPGEWVRVVGPVEALLAVNIARPIALSMVGKEGQVDQPRADLLTFMRVTCVRVWMTAVTDYAPGVTLGTRTIWYIPVEALVPAEGRVVWVYVEGEGA